MSAVLSYDRLLASSMPDLHMYRSTVAQMRALTWICQSLVMECRSFWRVDSGHICPVTRNPCVKQKQREIVHRSASSNPRQVSNHSTLILIYPRLNRTLWWSSLPCPNIRKPSRSKSTYGGMGNILKGPLTSACTLKLRHSS